MLGALVGDVEHRRHLVAVAGGEASGGEVDVCHHVAIDDGEALLLAGAHEHGAEYLDAVEIDAVLIEAAAADVVLRGELVVGADAHLRGYYLLYAVASGGGHVAGVVALDALHEVGLAAHGGDARLAEGVGHGGDLHVVAQRVGLRRGDEEFLGAVAHRHAGDEQGVGAVAPEAVAALGAADGEGSLALHDDGGELHGVVVFVHYLAVEAYLVLGHGAEHGEQRDEQ